MSITRGERFSDRLEIRRPTEGLIYEDAPIPVRHAFLNLLDWVNNILDGDWKRLYRILLGSVDRWKPDTGYVVSLNTIAHELVEPCTWYEFYDLVEAMVRVLEDNASLQALFVNRFNQILLRHYVGYELRDGKIERVGAREAEVAIGEARGILRDAELQPADEQFQKAIGFFNQRPQPDVENCVKDAVGAVEALARILLGKPSIQLNDAMKEIGDEKGIHKTLQQMVDKLYAYRGDAPGAAHGKTAAKPQITPPDAEFVLHTSAACIVSLARLYDKGVE
jgi:hypothetical protein